MLMCKENHQNVKFVEGDGKARSAVNHPNFRSLNELGEEFFEIVSAKHRIKLDMPIVIGYFILQYAKLRMLSFYYDFLDRYIERSDFEYIETDTDSAYIGISGNTLADIIKPHLKAVYDDRLKGLCHTEDIEANELTWFPRECCEKHAKRDRRTPGLFKLEASGDTMYALSSKTYLLKDGKDYKMSAKGVNKSFV